jgi:ferrous iron transport protein B
VAKEIVVGALGVIYGAGEDEEALTGSLQGDASFTALTGLNVMIFTLIYMPCLATVGVIKKETGSWKWTLFAIVYGIVLAYVVVLIVNNVGRLLGFGV